MGAWILSPSFDACHQRSMAVWRASSVASLGKPRRRAHRSRTSAHRRYRDSASPWNSDTDASGPPLTRRQGHPESSALSGVPPRPSHAWPERPCKEARSEAPARRAPCPADGLDRAPAHGPWPSRSGESGRRAQVVERFDRPEGVEVHARGHDGRAEGARALGRPARVEVPCDVRPAHALRRDRDPQPRAAARRLEEVALDADGWVGPPSDPSPGPSSSSLAKRPWVGDACPRGGRREAARRGRTPMRRKPLPSPAAPSVSWMGAATSPRRSDPRRSRSQRVRLVCGRSLGSPRRPRWTRPAPASAWLPPRS